MPPDGMQPHQRSEHTVTKRSCHLDLPPSLQISVSSHRSTEIKDTAEPNKLDQSDAITRATLGTTRTKSPVSSAKLCLQGKQERLGDFGDMARLGSEVLAAPTA